MSLLALILCTGCAAPGPDVDGCIAWAEEYVTLEGAYITVAHTEEEDGGNMILVILNQDELAEAVALVQETETTAEVVGEWSAIAVDLCVQSLMVKETAMEDYGFNEVEVHFLLAGMPLGGLLSIVDGEVRSDVLDIMTD